MARCKQLAGQTSNYTCARQWLAASSSPVRHQIIHVLDNGSLQAARRSDIKLYMLLDNGSLQAARPPD